MLTAKKFLLPVLTAVVALAVSPLPAAAQADPAPAAADEGEPDKKGRKACASRSHMSGYTVIDDRHFVLRSANRDYLITLAGGCHNLRTGLTLVIKSSRPSAHCIERFDRISADRMFSCVVKDIEQVEDTKAARKLVAERDAAEPEDDEGY